MAPIRHAFSRVMRSLVMKFTVLCGIILVAATAVLMGIEFQLKRTDNNAAGLRHAELITELFASNSAPYFRSGEPARLNGMLSEFGAREDVSSVYAADVNRRVLATTGECDVSGG
jgi:Na+-transporting NADH:ubiquinone oxidoreductase subunit NqrC